MGGKVGNPRFRWGHAWPCLCVLGVLAVVVLGFWVLVKMLSATPQGQFLQKGRAVYDYEAAIQSVMNYTEASAERNDVIFLGGSACRAAIQPILFEQLTGQRAYNLGSMEMMEFRGLEVMLRSYLRHHAAPRVLVVCVHPEEVTVRFPLLGPLRGVYIRYFECYDNAPMAPENGPWMGGFQRDARYALFVATEGRDGYRRVPISGLAMSYAQYDQTIRLNRGYLPVDAVMEDLKHLQLRPPGFPFVYTAQLCKGMDSLVQLARAHGVKVMVRFTPLPLGTPAPHRAGQESQDALRAWKSGLEQFCPGMKVSRPEILLYDRPCFQDHLHLNRRGAVLFTTYLAKEVGRLFPLSEAEGQAQSR